MLSAAKSSVMGVVAEKWISSYRTDHQVYIDAALEIELQLKEALNGRALGIQLIRARAKDPDSAAEKIVRKSYGRPSSQMTDVLGARVITLTDAAARKASQRIRDVFSVEDRHSVDKTLELRPREVGYRSTHLVLHPWISGIGRVQDVLRSSLVEVQIRSTVSHAWAEIEHSHRYKGGESVPADIQRRFDALAGTLELVDREFDSISVSLARHVEILGDRYAGSSGLSDSVGALELLAAMRALRPDAHPRGPDDLLMEIEDANSVAQVLRATGVVSVGDVMSAGNDAAVLAIVGRYSEDHDLDPSRASALVVLGAIVGSRDQDAFLGLKLFAEDQVLVESVTGVGV